MPGGRAPERSPWVGPALHVRLGTGSSVRWRQPQERFGSSWSNALVRPVNARGRFPTVAMSGGLATPGLQLAHEPFSGR